MASDQTNLLGVTDVLVELDGAGPLHEQLATRLREAIVQGRLQVGYVLPPSRRLAGELGCSRWVVTEAYGQLVAEGYLEARAGSVTRVRTSGRPHRGGERPVPRPPVRHDLTPGLPDLRSFPVRAWSDAVATEVRDVSRADLGFPPPGGHPRLKEALLAVMMPVRGVRADVEDVLVTTSVTDTTRALGAALRRLGLEQVAVEDPGWPALRRALTAAGLEVLPVPVDEQGLRVDRLSALPDVRAVLVTPAHQFPTGWPLSPSRRAELLEWAARVGGIVLEDDYDSEFRYDRRPVGTLQGMDPSRVVLLKSLSKTMSPALGIGWAIAPPWIRDALGPDLPPQPPVLDQLAFARLLESGAYLRHLRRLTPIYRNRRDLLVSALGEALPEARTTGAAAGLHVTLGLPADVTAEAVVRAAAASSLGVVDLAAYRCVPPASGPHDGLVLGYGNLNDHAVREAVGLLARVVAACR